MQNWLRRSMPHATRCDTRAKIEKSVEKKLVILTLEETESLFTLVALGLLFALVSFSWEKTNYWLTGRRAQKNSRTNPEALYATASNDIDLGVSQSRRTTADDPDQLVGPARRNNLVTEADVYASTTV